MKQVKYNLEANLHMLQIIAEKLDTLREKIVFVGGCATALLITDPAAPDVRQTMDVDCIVLLMWWPIVTIGILKSNCARWDFTNQQKMR